MSVVRAVDKYRNGQSLYQAMDCKSLWFAWK